MRMPLFLVVLSVIALAVGCRSGATPAETTTTILEYPRAPKDDTVDVLHGVRVPDPYRWLEDSDSSRTRSWIESENALTRSHLDAIPEREWIRKRLTHLWNYEKFGLPFKEGGRYFMTRNDGLQNQSVLLTAETLDAESRVLLDPNQLSGDGTVSAGTYTPSRDARYLAYTISRAGSDWREIKVRDIATGQDLDDHLEWVKFSSISWTHDSEGFFYSRYDAPTEGSEKEQSNHFHKVYYHRVGTPQSADTLFHERADHATWNFWHDLSSDGNWLVLGVSTDTTRNHAIFYRDARNPQAPAVALLDRFDAQYGFIGNEGPIFYFETNLDAPMDRIIAIDFRDPHPTSWREAVPQSEHTIRRAELVGGHLVVTYLVDAHSQVKVFRTDGTLVREVALPGLGSARGFSGEPDDPETFYSFASYTIPPTIYRYDVATGESRMLREAKVDFDPTPYATEQVFYTSKDGTEVPMFLTHRTDLSLDGNNPTHLYGYGGFNISTTPRFSVSDLVWLEMGGVLAHANLRGGGEYGAAWHEAGTKLNKQNVFDDFISAAEYLIDNGYTSTPKLAIAGRSNGGLLVGACMTQRPDLFGACLPAVGVMDMLRFHKFTIGWAWTSDYGSPDDAREFAALRAYSPLHNVKDGTCYPPTLITTADHDDRVVPAHSYKFAAALQAAQGCDNPILIRIQTRAGHGSGTPTTIRIEQITDRLGFLVRSLGMTLELEP